MFNTHHPHNKLLQNTLNRLNEILYVGNNGHDFDLLGFAFKASRLSFAMKFWICICNQGVVDRAYFIIFELVLVYYVLSSGKMSLGNAEFFVEKDGGRKKLVFAVMCWLSDYCGFRDTSGVRVTSTSGKARKSSCSSSLVNLTELHVVFKY